MTQSTANSSVVTSSAGAAPNRRMTPQRWALSIVGVIVVLMILYVFMNRYTPYTSDAYVQRYVVQMAPLVAGRVTKVYVTDNAKVKAGDPLFDLDASPFEFDLHNAQAKLAMARQQVAALQRDVIIAEASLTDSKELLNTAQSLFDEMKKMRDADAASYLEYVTALNRLEERKSSVRQTEAMLEKAKLALAAVIDNEHALIRQAEAEVKTAQWRLDQARVFAPGDGYVTNLQLQPGASVTMNVPVMTFVDAGTWWVVADFNENALSRIKPGDEAEISLRSQPGRVHKAKVDSMGWGVERGQGLPSGRLPAPDRGQVWIRPPQRLPVRLQIDANTADNFAAPPVGASVSVTVYTARTSPFNPLAALWQRVSAAFDNFY